jgi:hypothetical protein
MISARSIKKQLWYLKANFALNATLRAGKMPILVHQMGKVGSTTICSELRRNSMLPPVFQTHFISRESLEEANRITDDWGRKSPHLKIGASLMPLFENRNEASPSWHIVTVVRDPVARQLSDVYENPEVIGVEHGATPDPSNVIDYLTNYFENFDEDKDYVCQWFEREIIRQMNIPLYEMEFPQEQNYQLIEHAGIRLLAFRIEDYADILNEGVAFNQWLGQSVKMNASSSNSASDRDSFESYKRVKSGLKIPKSALDRIYDTKFSRHFYADHRDALIHKWSS